MQENLAMIDFVRTQGLVHIVHMPKKAYFEPPSPVAHTVHVQNLLNPIPSPWCIHTTVYRWAPSGDIYLL